MAGPTLSAHTVEPASQPANGGPSKRGAGGGAAAAEDIVAQVPLSLLRPAAR